MTMCDVCYDRLRAAIIAALVVDEESAVQILFRTHHKS